MREKGVKEKPGCYIGREVTSSYSIISKKEDITNNSGEGVVQKKKHGRSRGEGKRKVRVKTKRNPLV